METGRWLYRRSRSLLGTKAGEESGFIMILLLLAFAVISTFAVALAVRTRVEMKLAANYIAGTRAELQARSGIQYAMAFIEKQNCSIPNIDKAIAAVSDDEEDAKAGDLGSLGWQVSIKNTFDIDSEPGETDDGFDVEISDEAGRLNVNTAGSEELSALLGDLKDAVPSILDWIDADNEPRAGGAESDYYQKLEVPLEPRNGSIKSISELRYIKGITKEAIAEGGSLPNRLTVWSWEPDLAPDGKPKRKLASRMGDELRSAPISLSNAEAKALDTELAKAGQPLTMLSFAKAVDTAVKNENKKALALEYIYAENEPTDGGFNGKINVLSASADVLSSVVGTRAAEAIGQMRAAGSLGSMWDVYTALIQAGDQQALSRLEKLECGTRCFRLRSKGFYGEISREITAVVVYTGSDWRTLYYEN